MQTVKRKSPALSAAKGDTIACCPINGLLITWVLLISISADEVVSSDSR